MSSDAIPTEPQNATWAELAAYIKVLRSRAAALRADVEAEVRGCPPRLALIKEAQQMPSGAACASTEIHAALVAARAARQHLERVLGERGEAPWRPQLTLLRGGPDDA